MPGHSSLNLQLLLIGGVILSTRGKKSVLFLPGAGAGLQRLVHAAGAEPLEVEGDVGVPQLLQPRHDAVDQVLVEQSAELLLRQYDPREGVVVVDTGQLESEAILRRLR